MLSENSKNPVTLKDLTFKQQIKIIWWKLRHRSLDRPIERPLASWAQMLYAFGIAETRELKDAMAEADSTPKDVPVAIQRVQLHDLGYIALLLGFNSVRIRPHDHEIDAIGPHARIYTQALSDVGKVARFEGNIFAVHSQIAIGYPIFLQNNSEMVLGKFVFGGELVSLPAYCRIDVVVEALRERLSQHGFSTRLQHSLEEGEVDKNGWIGMEASIFKKIWPSNQTPVSCSKFQHLSSTDDIQDIRIPTIYAALTFANIPATSLGFPSDVLIGPFMQWLCQRANDFWNQKTFKVPEVLRTDLGGDRINFLRRDGGTWMSKNYLGMDEKTGWTGWDHGEIATIYWSCSDNVQKQIIPRLPNENNTLGEPEIVLFPDTASLLEKFQVREWDNDLKRNLIFSPNSYSPKSMIWAQIMILDVGIHYLIHGRWPEGDFKKHKDRSLAVMSAIKNAWIRATKCNWDLVGTIGAENILTFSPRPSTPPSNPDLANPNPVNPNLGDQIREGRVKKLANMLELRAIFYLAFLIIGPDSSDVYVTRDSEVEVVII